MRAVVDLGSRYGDPCTPSFLHTLRSVHRADLGSVGLEQDLRVLQPGHSGFAPSGPSLQLVALRWRQRSLDASSSPASCRALTSQQAREPSKHL